MGYSIKAYGAVGDGVTNDTAAFMAAIAAGVPLEVPDGDYVITTSLTFPNAVSFQPGGKLSVATGVTVAFGNVFEAGLYQVFALAGTAAVAFNPRFTNLGWPEWWGAKGGDLTFDSFPAFDAAVKALTAVRFGAVPYRLSQTLIIPGGVDFGGVGFIPNQNATGSHAGSTLMFDTDVLICLQATAGHNATCTIHDLTVQRATLSVPARSVGLKVNDAYNVQLYNVEVIASAITLQLYCSKGVDGISCHVEGLVLSGWTDTAIEIDSWPEFYLNNGRIGGPLDAVPPGDAPNSYLRMTGGGTGGVGPNTVFITQSQFNGSELPKYFIELSNATPGSTAGNFGGFRFVECHFEGIRTAAIYADSTITYLNDLTITDCAFNCPDFPMWMLDPAVEPADWSLKGNSFFCSTFDLAPTAQFNYVNMVGNLISGAMNLEIPAGSIITGANNVGTGGITLSGAGSISLLGDYYGNFVNNCTGVVSWIPPVANRLPWTPVLEFGGSAAGITYTAQNGQYQCVGGFMTVSGVIILSSKGTAAGAAAITGLPLPANLPIGASGGGVAPYAENMAGLTGPVVLNTAGDSKTIFLVNFGPTGGQSLSNANFTDTSALFFTVTYPV